MHWSDAYVGRPYIAGTGDCAALAQTIAWEVFRVQARLPISHATSLREQTAQILSHKDALAERIESPEDGCPALFVGRGRLCHIGVMCWLANEWWVLHADKLAGAVVRQRLRDMTRIHFKTEGFYKWK